MNEFDLKDLPKFTVSKAYADRLFADAVSVMPRNSAPHGMSKSVPLWASFALAASLALGVWLGFGQGAVMQQSLSALGFAQITTASELGIDAYNETLLALN